MPLTYTTVRTRNVQGNRRETEAVYTGPASYVNPGGETITANDLNLGIIEGVALPNIVPDSAGANLRILSVNYAAAGTSITIRWWTDLTTEVGNAVDLSGYTDTRIIVTGR